jgi:hypothetical protein
MERSSEEVYETVRRLVLIWAAGDPDKVTLDTTIEQFAGTYRVHELHRWILGHLFLVALECESAEPIGRELSVQSTLREAIAWLMSKPPPDDSEDYLEWSEQEREFHDD